jgi:integrase
MLPIAWAADTVPEAVALITRLHHLVEDGVDLADALDREFGSVPAAAPTSSTQWPWLLERFHDDLKLTNGTKPVTWKDNYLPFLEYGVDLMGGAKSPSNARELVSEVVKRWAENARSRQKAVAAWKAFLSFAVEVHNIPAQSWTLTDRAAKQLRGQAPKKRTVACITDVEILDLLDSFPETAAGDRWRNAVKLMALYGLRPEELHHLVVAEHPTTKQPALKCTYLKAAQKNAEPSRWLMPLPLTDSTGELVEWNLAGAMAIGQLSLPPLSDKYAPRTFLMRQSKWIELMDKYETVGEWVRPYSFRNSYSVRAHNTGHLNSVVCTAMGHSLAVHSTSYEYARRDEVLKHI